LKFCTVAFFILLFGCGSEGSFNEDQNPECQPSDVGYLHTAFHCGEFIPENVRSIFILCNPLKSNDRGGCCQEDIIREQEDNCFLTNVCIEPWEYE
jgi:hypothetical protein